mmetsp:Transcript_31361/g.89976  ORF Transcript_31361/g.89976 Transcript_31361/m.89976 type:complete len:255 (+) Transcript_31361:1-765(+)
MATSPLVSHQGTPEVAAGWVEHQGGRGRCQWRRASISCHPGRAPATTWHHALQPYAEGLCQRWRPCPGCLLVRVHARTADPRERKDLRQDDRGSCQERRRRGSHSLAGKRLARVRHGQHLHEYHDRRMCKSWPARRCSAVAPEVRSRAGAPWSRGLRQRHQRLRACQPARRSSQLAPQDGGCLGSTWRLCLQQRCQRLRAGWGGRGGGGMAGEDAAGTDQAQLRVLQLHHPQLRPGRRRREGGRMARLHGGRLP